MIKLKTGDITKMENVEYISNAANGVGILGAGVAGAIRRVGGEIIEQQAKQLCTNIDIQPGDVYITEAGNLPYEGIIHLCTMKNPGSLSNLNIIKKCLENLIIFCKEENIKDVAIPALGTGIGKVNKVQVAKLYVSMLNEKQNINFHVIDIDADFIAFVDMYLKMK